MPCVFPVTVHPTSVILAPAARDRPVEPPLTITPARRRSAPSTREKTGSASLLPISTTSPPPDSRETSVTIVNPAV